MKNTEYVNFTLGDRTGILLMQIAQEHLIYNNNPQKAIDAIRQSLIGVDMDLTLKILKGDMILLVEDNQFICTERIPDIHGTIFPYLDCAGHARRRASDIVSTARHLRVAIEEAERQMRYGKSISLSFSYDSIINFLEGDDKDLIEDILEDDRVSALQQLITVVKAFIEKSSKEMDTIHFMRQTWPSEFNAANLVYPNEARQLLKTTLESFSELMRTNYLSIANEENADLDNYLKAVIEIDKIVNEGIMPVDIMDNYSAGWLSPEGEYYALNGEIANMLHNQIADALYEKGIIPESVENKNNPDNWLQYAGWVRIHGRHINFEAHMNERINRGENKFMTDKQIDMITEYCRLHHNGIVKVFFQDLSALSFQLMIKGNPIGFYQKYLDW